MTRKGVGLRDVPGAVVGIDLGTTYSVVGACRRGKVEIFTNDNGNRTTPSIVSFLDGKAFVGDAAKHLHASASNRVFNAKRLVGRDWGIAVDVDGTQKTLSTEQISGMVLRGLKKTAEAALGHTVSRAVITVPAYFNEKQRQAANDACRVAGMEVLSVINEPMAAAIAYGLDKPTGSAKTKTVFTFHLGGGTFDVSVMRICGSEFEVLASGGDNRLGGHDFNVLLRNYCLQDAKQRLNNVDLAKDEQAMRDLRKACELAKQELSSKPLACVRVSSRANVRGYTAVIWRATFEDLCLSLFKKTIEISERVLSEAKVTRADVDDVVLVGGSTRIPKVRALLGNMFGGNKLRQSINPDEAVAYGAAMHAAVLTGEKFFDRVPSGASPNALKHALSAIMRVKMRIKGALGMVKPVKPAKFKDLTPVLKDVLPLLKDETPLLKDVLPLLKDETPLLKDVVTSLLKDKTPLSLGIECDGNVFHAVIGKNTSIPCKKTKRYHTSADYQKNVKIKVFQGERVFVKDNHYLNKSFDIEVPPKPKGQATIDVTFEIDQSGLLTVSAVEPTSRRKMQVGVTPQEAHLSKADIKAMIEKAKRFKQVDEVEKRLRLPFVKF